MGIARTPQELRTAAEEASLVGGVKQVVSYIRLREAAARQAAPIRTEAPAAPQPAPTYQAPLTRHIQPSRCLNCTAQVSTQEAADTGVSLPPQREAIRA